MKEIVQDGHPALRDGAQPVPESMFGTPELDRIVADMAEALDAQADGVAIAAPQIAIPYRIFLVRYDRMVPGPADPARPAELGVFINPEFVKVARRREVMDEGCLSVRGRYGKTYRHERATVRARLPDGTAFTRGGGGVLAQAFQHEIDHLDGILFIDHALETYTVDRSAAGGGDTHHE